LGTHGPGAHLPLLERALLPCRGSWIQRAAARILAIDGALNAACTAHDPAIAGKALPIEKDVCKSNPFDTSFPFARRRLSWIHSSINRA